MGQTKKTDELLRRRVDDYLRGFPAGHPTAGSPGADASLEEYLLERAARELKAARNHAGVVEKPPVRE